MLVMAQIERIKILIADDDGQLSRGLSSFISDHGFECKIAQTGMEARELILDWKPKIVLADLMLPEFNAFQMMEFIRNEHTLRHQVMHVIVMSGHNSKFNVKQAFDKGAKDYLVKPMKMQTVLQRLVFHCRSYRHLKDFQKKEYKSVDESSLMLHLTDLVLRQAISPTTIQEKLFNLTRMVSMKVDGVRCSIIHVKDQETGFVVTSNDDMDATGIQLDLTKYPEVLNVVNTGHLIAIENLEASRELKPIRKLLSDIQFNSMIVCPVHHRGQVFGVLSLRMPADKKTVSDNEIRFVEIVGHVASLLLEQEKLSNSNTFWEKHSRAKTIPFPKKKVSPK